MAGTSWRDVLKFYPEIYGNLDFSVGGSVDYGDAGFGFNEFKLIKDRVEVEAYLNGNKYQGKYKGGIIYSVLVRKESKELVTKGLETKDFDVVYYKLKTWFSSSYPPFRDITIVWKDGKFILNATYTKAREELLKKYTAELQDFDLIYEESNFPHKFRYFGLTNLDNLNLIKSQISKSISSFIRVSFGRVYLSVYSNEFLNLPNVELSSFSDTINDNKLNGCIMCGKCVEVCPYSEFKNSPAYSPLGFYTLQALNSYIQINCHMCGKCVEVCPAKLDILSDISKTAIYDIKLNVESPRVREIKSNRIILITPISIELQERLLKALLYLYSRGTRVGVKYLDINLQDLVKGKIDWKNLASQLSGISQIITITPEEYYYLQSLLRYVVLDITYIEDYTLPEIDLDKSKLHIPCFLRDLEKKIKPSKCSFAFLDLLNNTNSPSYIKDEITLCPFTAKKNNIKTPLDMLIPHVNLNIINEIENKIKEKLSDSIVLLEDAKWYSGLADQIYQGITNRLLNYAVQDLPEEKLLILYLLLDKTSFSEEEKKILEEKIIQLLTK